MPEIQVPKVLQPPDPRALPIESTHIIIGSALGGTTFILFSLLLLFYYTVWRRHRDARTLRPSGQHSSTIQVPPNTLTIRAVSPSLHRLGTIPFQSPPSPPPVAAAPDPPVLHSGSARWDIEKGIMTTPAPHPALLWSHNNNGSGGSGVDGDNGDLTTNTVHHRNIDKISSSSEPIAASLLPPAATTTTTTTSTDNLRIRPSVSSTFAAELSSLLESISIKSSYSSLRCGGLGAPPPRRTSRTTQQQQQQQQKKEQPSAEEEKDGKDDVRCAVKGIEQTGQTEQTGYVGAAAVVQVNGGSPSAIEQGEGKGRRVEQEKEIPGNVIFR